MNKYLKQLMVATVASAAAVMSVPAMAMNHLSQDMIPIGASSQITISGRARVNYTNFESTAGVVDTSGTTTTPATYNTEVDGNGIRHEIDLFIEAVAGDNLLHLNIENAVGGGAAYPEFGVGADADGVQNREARIKNIFVQTKVAGVTLKVGTWWSSQDYITDGDGSRSSGRVSITSEVSGVGFGFHDGSNRANNPNGTSFSGSYSTDNTSVRYEIGAHNWTNLQLGASRGPFAVNYNTTVQEDAAGIDTSATSYRLDATLSGVRLSYVSGERDNAEITHDDYFGYYYLGINEISGFGAQLGVAGNTITLQNFKTDNTLAATSEYDNSRKYTRVVIQRPLASGAVLTGTYRNQSSDLYGDSRLLDIEVSVDF